MGSFLKKYFIPHEGNDHKPHILRWTTVRVFIAVLIVLEGVFLLQVGVNRYSLSLADIEASVLAADTNANRIENGLPPLSINPSLSDAAQMKANDMATKGYFSHTGPDGSTPWDWIIKAGYQYSYAGENIAINFVDSADVVSAWMASPEHRANILDSNYTEMGYGIAEGEYQGNQTIFVDQMFGAPPESPAILAITNTQSQSSPTSTANSNAGTTPAVSSNDQSATTASSGEQQAMIASSSILGASTIASTAAKADIPLGSSLIDQVISSPLIDTDYIFAVIAVIFLVALGLKLFTKATIRHPALIFNGALMIFIVNCLLLANKYIAVTQLKIL